MKKLLIILMFALTVITPAPGADVLGIGTSARSIGLGRCFVGITDVGECVFGNPAGLQGLKRIEMASMYTELSGDVKYTLVGVSAPTAVGNVGFGYASNKIGDIFATTLDATGRPATLEPFSYGTDMLVLDYSNSINDLLAYGLRLKYLDKGGSIVSAGRGTGFNLDLGLSYDPDENTRLGAVVENAIAGGPCAIRWSNGVEEEMPFVLNIGGRHRMERLGTTVYSDFSFRKTMPFEMRAGAEWNAWGPLDLRAGLEQVNSSSTGKYINYSLGVGYSTSAFRIDYAYYLDTMLDYNSRHYVSFAVSLPMPEKAASGEVIVPEKLRFNVRDIEIFMRNLDRADWRNGRITRAEFVRVLERSIIEAREEEKSKTTYSFMDVPANSTAAPYIAVAKRDGHVTGYPNEAFRPARAISRAEFVTIVMSAFDMEPGKIRKRHPDNSFEDVPQSHWAEIFVTTARQRGAVVGSSGQGFMPRKKITKEEAMAVLRRMKKEAAEEEVKDAEIK